MNTHSLCTNRYTSSCSNSGQRILVTAPILALVISAFMFFWLAPVRAQASAGPCHATPDNGTTVFSSADAHAVQQAVDASASGGHVKVAGTCVGVEARAGASQSTYISKTLTLSGGYTTGDWMTSDPLANPAVIDANGGGRVLRITNVLVEIAALTLQGGNFTANGGGVVSSGPLRLIGVTVQSNTTIGQGGGLWAFSTLALTNTRFISNTAGEEGGGAFASGAATAVNSRFENNCSTDSYGGGLFASSTLMLTNTHFVSNTADGFGGGAMVFGDATAAGSRFENNRSMNADGGGLYARSTLSLTNTHFISNTANDAGGGVAAFSVATAANSRFENNHSMNGQGGGLSTSSTLALTNTHFIRNTAYFSGGGAFSFGAARATNSRFENNHSTTSNGGGLFAGSTLALTNTLFLRNRAGDDGGGVFLFGNFAATERLVNVLLAGNWANDGDAVYVRHKDGDDSLTILYTTIASPTVAAGAAVVVQAGTAVITDTIIVSHTTGIQRIGGTVTQGYNLFFGNGANTGGTVGGGTGSTTGDPAFVNPATDDYQLTALSAAIDMGVDVGVTSDFFGDPRPQGTGFDAGYDESPYTPVGSIVIRKVVVGAPPADVWQFMGPTIPFTLPAVGGTAVFTPVAAGPYTLSETPKQYYTAVSACSSGASGAASVDVTLGGGQTITCTFTNTRSIGLVTIIKEATPKSTQNFNFSAGPPTPLLNGGNESGALGNFILDDAVPSDNDAYPKQRSFLLPNGVYSFGEAPPSNWKPKAIECTADAGSSFTVTVPNVQITLGGGDVTCTFKNELTVTIQTLKYRDNNGNGVRNAGEAALAGWAITATLQPTGTPAYGPLVTNGLGRANFNFLPAGSYKVCETLTGGWTNTQPGGAEPCYTVTLNPGQTASVNFGNRPGALAADTASELAPLSPYPGVTITDGDPNALDGYAVDWAAWVDAVLLTPVEEPVDAPDTTTRMYLPVVVR